MATPVGQQAALADLLGDAVDGVLAAQRRLDEDALSRTTVYMNTPRGDIALPPLWYTLTDVTLQLEMAATVRRVARVGGGDASLEATAGVGHAARLEARLLNPAAVSLFGYTASSGLKVALHLSPREAGGPVPLLPAGAAAEPPALPAPSTPPSETP